ncbi:MAG: HAD-IG family 5'-nucleotidase [Syntrophobacteraceae bacterium]
MPETKCSHVPHGIYCNRTLNLGAVRAIGYDMDYTLIHYRMQSWEERAYRYVKEGLRRAGWPVEHLVFDSDLAMRGLVIDIELGNVVKANRFGYIKRAFHGSRPLEFDVQRRSYQRVLVDLNEPRWHFLNTLFSISEACLFMQLVDLLDGGALPGCLGYEDLFRRIRRAADEAHMEGRLKAEIISDPDQFVEPDEDIPLTLLDQKKAGKKILLISNSEWSYAGPMLAYAFDRFMPKSRTWRDLFDIIIVGARKPDFFSLPMPAFEVVDEQAGLLREHRGPLVPGRVYMGANAGLVERSLGVTGEEILYVGDHIFVDVNVSKSVLRWRTALVIRELEEEIAVMERFESQQAELAALMEAKERMELQYCSLRLLAQRIQKRYGPHLPGTNLQEFQRGMAELHDRIAEIDARISPFAQASGQLLNPNWGLLMRTGIDKSHLARQVERYADIYMARVSNFLRASPFAFLRSSRMSLPHDRECRPGNGAPFLEKDPLSGPA